MNPEQKIILLVGLPGSGKSTFGNELLKEHPEYVLLSSDAIRAEIGTGENDQSVTPQVFVKLKERLKTFVSDNKTVIVDATNINIQDRKFYVDLAKQAKIKIMAYVFVCDKQTLLIRNIISGNAGDRNVPEFVIDKMLKKYEMPSLNEGLTEIHVK